MSNPFDSNFFKFLGGFMLILGISFAILFITQSFVSTGEDMQSNASSIDSKIVLKIVK